MAAMMAFQTSSSRCCTLPARSFPAARVAPRLVARNTALAASRHSCRMPCVRAAAETIEAETPRVEAPTAAPKTPYKPSFDGVLGDKYAIIAVGGVQHIVQEGRWYTCNRLQAEPGSKIQFGRVLAVKNGGDFGIGQPYLEGATVEAEVLENFRGPKLIVFKMRPKKHYRRKNGHRQQLTKFLVTKISPAAS